MILAQQTLSNGGPGTPFSLIRSTATVSIVSLSGIVVVERSMDSGTTWTPLLSGVDVAEFTVPGAFAISDTSAGARFRINQTSGTGCNYRVDV